METTTFGGVTVTRAEWLRHAVTALLEDTDPYGWKPGDRARVTAELVRDLRPLSMRAKVAMPTLSEVEEAMRFVLDFTWSFREESDVTA